MELYKAMFIVRDEGTIDGYATEHFVDISLHDFEEIYGKETREIEAVTLVKTGNFKKINYLHPLQSMVKYSCDS